MSEHETKLKITETKCLNGPGGSISSVLIAPPSCGCSTLAKLALIKLGIVGLQAFQAEGEETFKLCPKTD
jgi:hypothetical protein